VVLHLPDGTNIGPLTHPINGTVVPPGGPYNMTVTLGNFPCNGPGLVCFPSGGTPGTAIRGKCAPGTCATVAFNTSNSLSTPCPNDNPPGGQCRHQTVCIQHFGADLACNSTTCGGTKNCSVGCGGTAKLTACVTAAAVTSGTPFTYTLYRGSTALSDPAPVVTNATSVDFTVPVTETATYTVKVCDSRLGANCCRVSLPVTLSTQSTAAPTVLAGTPDCSGKVIYTVQKSDPSLSYTLKEVNCSSGAVIEAQTPVSGNGGDLLLSRTYTQDGFDHCAIVTATNGSAGCEGTSQKLTSPINYPVSTPTVNPGTPDCSGAVTFTVPNSDPHLSYTLKEVACPNGAVSQTFQTLSGNGGDLLLSHTFTPQQADTDHCVIVTASNGDTPCDKKSGAVSVTIKALVTKPTLSAGTPDCSGKVTFTVGSPNLNLTYTFQEVDCGTGAPIGQPLGSGKGLTSVSPTFPQDGNDHCVTVTASNGTVACDKISDKATAHINLPVSVELVVPGDGVCGDGSPLTVTANASGGTGTYTYTFKVGTTIVHGPGSSNQFPYGPVTDNLPHTIRVEVQDSAGCPLDPAAASAAKTVTQCVKTSVS
jgi:hypothetical protein